MKLILSVILLSATVALAGPLIGENTQLKDDRKAMKELIDTDSFLTLADVDDAAGEVAKVTDAKTKKALEDIFALLRKVAKQNEKAKSKVKDK